MPIKIPNDLPATKVLYNENIFFMSETRAVQQDIRPLKVLILNLMPNKIQTETQLLRLLGNSPIQLEIELLQVESHAHKNTSADHLLRFYKTFSEVKNDRFDGMIITGAPVELLEFEDVDYWDELCEIMEWSKKNVCSTFHICWAAQAGLHYHHGVNKIKLDKKMFGVFEHDVVEKRHNLLQGFDDKFFAPHSRHTDIVLKDIELNPNLKILSYSQDAGAYIICDIDNKQFFVTGHSEYDDDTLANEYFRDKNNNLDIDLPQNYFPDNNPENTPVVKWRGHSNLLFTNWLNYFVYQQTPYDLENL